MATTVTPDPTGGPAAERRPLHTVALVKQVPLGDHPGTLDDRGRLRRDGFAAELNPWCRRAVTRAVELGHAAGGRTTVVTMGPPSAADVLREALACGADEGLHVCDAELAGADCLVTARALAAAIRTLGPVDLVLVGRSTVDGGTGTVGPMVAELLGLPFAGPALTVETAGARELRTVLQLDAVTETAALALPAVLAVAERSCRPAKAAPDTWPDPAPIRTLTADRLTGARPGATSPTRVDRVRHAAATRRPVLLSGTPAEQAARAVALITARASDGRAGPLAALTAPDDDTASGPFARPAAGTVPGAGAVPQDVAPVAPVPHDAVPAAPELAAPASRRADLVGPAVLAVAGSPHEGGRALLGEAARIAARVGGHVVAVTPPADTEALAAWGADAAVRLTGTDPRPAAAALAALARGSAVPPWAVLGGATPWDREVLARLAVLLDAGLLSDLTSVEAAPDGRGGLRLAGGKPAGNGTFADVSSTGWPQIATLRTGALAAPAPRTVRAPIPVETLDVAADPHLRRWDRRVEDDFDALDRAATVIGLGAGVDPARYGDVESLRALLGAELAATRKVTDAGALAHCRQLGVTGRAVAPRLYLAIGISGSHHHLAGVERAHTVVAVNSDPDAAVFAHCDIGIVAGWQEVLPALTDAFRRALRPAPATAGAR